MSRGRVAGLLARLGGACARSSTLADAAAPSCSYASGSAAGGWRSWTAPMLAAWRAGGAAPGLGCHCGGAGGSVVAAPWWSHQAARGFAFLPAEAAPNYLVGLNNLRDNPGATRQRIRVGRGNGGRRGNYGGRGMKGHKSRGRGPHMLYDGGQLGLLKFPVTRQRPPYEVLYYQLGLSRVVEWVQLGLLDARRTITMKDLYDSGCVTSNIKFGVLLYGRARLPYPLDLQVTAADPDTRACVEAAGGRLVRVYYTKEGLGAILHPEKYTARRLPLPLPAVRWHPKYDGRFDAIGLIPPAATAVGGLPAVAAAAARALAEPAPKPALAAAAAS